MATRSTRATFFTIAAAAALILAAASASQLVLTSVRIMRMAAWPTVPATLDSVELHRPGSATSRSLSVGAQYHYVIDGRSYVGTRVSVYQPDSLGSFFQRTYNDLHGRVERQQSVDVHVNPAEPADAVILPVWRPEWIAFQVTLLVLGCGAAWWAMSARRAPSPDAEGVAPADDGAPPAERAATTVAWGRRLALVGLVLLAGGYVLLDRARDDRFPLIARLVAREVLATGTVFVSPPDARVPGIVAAVAAALPVAVGVDVDAHQDQSVTYRLSVRAPGRAQALADLERVERAVREQYRADTSRDLTTFADAYVAPVMSPARQTLANAIVALVGLVGVLCLAFGSWLASRAGASGPM